MEISGSVIDFGGLFWPVKGRTKTWDVSEYKIFDIKSGRKGVKADYVGDLNYAVSWREKFDNAFLIEVTDHLWNPVNAFWSINGALKPGGVLYVSSNFLFPHHTGFDCIRLTRVGLKKILSETGFEVLQIEPRFASDVLKFGSVMRTESKVYYSPGEIGYMLAARKL